MTVIYSPRMANKKNTADVQDTVQVAAVPALRLYTFPTVGDGFSCYAESQEAANKLAAAVQSNFK